MNNNRLLYAYAFIILVAMNVEASLFEYNVPSCKKAYLGCKTFDIEKYCYIKGNVKAESGSVGDSMTATNIFIESTLKVGDHLACDTLVCKNLIVGDDVKVAELKAEKCIVIGSMFIKYKAFISEILSVGGLLTCSYLVNPKQTMVDNINAVYSDLGHVCIKKSSQDCLSGSTKRVNSCILGLSHDKEQYKQSQFIHCKVKSIFAGERQIIVLCGKTIVTGDIFFEEDIEGIVYLSEDSYIYGKVFNGAVYTVK